MIKDLIVLTILLSIFDSTYLYLNRNLYTSILNDIKKINLLYCPIIWFVIALGIYFLIIKNNDSFFNLILKSFILGLSIYVTFNVTSYIVFNNKWSMNVGLIDTLWGITLIMITSIIYKYILS